MGREGNPPHPPMMSPWSSWPGAFCALPQISCVGFAVNIAKLPDLEPVTRPGPPKYKLSKIAALGAWCWCVHDEERRLLQSLDHLRRTAFSQGFIRDFALVWAEEGLEAVRKVAKKSPEAFVAIAARICPNKSGSRLNKPFLGNELGRLFAHARSDCCYQGRLARSRPIAARCSISACAGGAARLFEE